jgi:hypothetical protein
MFIATITDICLMPLQNRVTPNGDIISTTARGGWMGNRGQLHNGGKEILRLFKLKAWLICLLDFNDRKRQVMAPNRYTELFFFDEATAFAAGHRPCFECRRPDYQRFKTYWLKGNPGYGFTEKTGIAQIDQILHNERIGPKGEKVVYEENIQNLPDGTFILMNGQPFLLANNQLYGWTASGYDKVVPITNTEGKVTVLTPKSTVNAFKAGYQPQIIISASWQ